MTRPNLSWRKWDQVGQVWHGISTPLSFIFIGYKKSNKEGPQREPMIPETTEILIGIPRDLTLVTDDMILTQIGMLQGLEKYMFSAVGSTVVKCLTGDRGAVGLSLTGVTGLCPRARHINPRTGSTQEDPSLHNRKIVNETKRIKSNKHAQRTTTWKVMEKKFMKALWNPWKSIEVTR